MHTVQFYETDRFLQRAAERFLAPALHHGHPAVMIARPRTFEMVADHLTTGGDFSPTQSFDPGRIMFVNAEATLERVMDGARPDERRLEQGIAEMVDDVRRDGHDGQIRVFGEMVDLLSRDGRHAAAIQIEEAWNRLTVGLHVTTMCAYSLQGFDVDVESRHLLEVCRQHTHVAPAEEFTDPSRDRDASERIALLQHRTRIRDRQMPVNPAIAETATGIVERVPTVYVVDDDPSVRRALARLLSLAEWQVQTFASGEAFLAGADPTAEACLILDVQLVGMSGIDLQLRMASAGWRLPVIAISASQDTRIEREALRLGAHAFLRKPFEPQRLMDVVARTLRTGHTTTGSS